MDPLVVPRCVGQNPVESPEYTGDAVILELRIPVSRLADISRNDALRRELADLIKAVLPINPP